MVHLICKNCPCSFYNSPLLYLRIISSIIYHFTAVLISLPLKLLAGSYNSIFNKTGKRK